MIVAMVVLGGLGHLPGVIIGAILLSALPEVLRYVAGPLQEMSGGRLDASILRQLLIAVAMITIMLMKPRGLWPAPDHGKSLNGDSLTDPKITTLKDIAPLFLPIIFVARLFKRDTWK